MRPPKVIGMIVEKYSVYTEYNTLPCENEGETVASVVFMR